MVNTTQDVETTYVRSRSCCISFIIVNLHFCPDILKRTSFKMQKSSACSLEFQLSNEAAMSPYDRTSTTGAQTRATHESNPRARKNVREESAGFTLSLDHLLTDACEVVDKRKSSLIQSDLTATSPKTVLSPRTETGVVHTNAGLLPSASPGSKRKSHEAFDHDAVANFLNHGAWNDLLPQAEDGSSAAVLNDTALLSAAATLGFGPIPPVQSESSSCAMSSSRPHRVRDTRATNLTNEDNAPLMRQPDQKQRVLALHPEEESVYTDTASAAHPQVARSWNDLAPQPADTSENTQAVQGVSADLPLNPSAVPPPATAVLKNLNSGISPSSSSLTAVTEASTASRWAVRDAVPDERGCCTLNTAANVEVKRDETITGLAPAHQKFGDASRILDGSSDCIAFALAGVLA